MTVSFKSGVLQAAAVLLWLLAGASQFVQAQTPVQGPQVLSAQDAAQVRMVVQSQLAAFVKDDAVKAFSYAAPNIRKIFGTAPAFLDMVRRSYPMVYRPSSSAFLVVEGAGSQAVQRVQMQDAAGDHYLATYTLERQRDKTWRITGCQVAASKGQTA